MTEPESSSAEGPPGTAAKVDVASRRVSDTKPRREPYRPTSTKPATTTANLPLAAQGSAVGSTHVDAACASPQSPTAHPVRSTPSLQAQTLCTGNPSQQQGSLAATTPTAAGSAGTQLRAGLGNATTSASATSPTGRASLPPSLIEQIRNTQYNHSASKPIGLVQQQQQQQHRRTLSYSAVSTSSAAAGASAGVAAPAPAALTNKDEKQQQQQQQLHARTVSCPAATETKFTAASLEEDAGELTCAHMSILSINSVNESALDAITTTTTTTTAGTMTLADVFAHAPATHEPIPREKMMYARMAHVMQRDTVRQFLTRVWVRWTFSSRVRQRQLQQSRQHRQDMAPSTHVATDPFGSTPSPANAAAARARVSNNASSSSDSKTSSHNNRDSDKTGSRDEGRSGVFSSLPPWRPITGGGVRSGSPVEDAEPELSCPTADDDLDDPAGAEAEHSASAGADADVAESVLKRVHTAAYNTSVTEPMAAKAAEKRAAAGTAHAQLALTGSAGKAQSSVTATAALVAESSGDGSQSGLSAPTPPNVNARYGNRPVQRETSPSAETSMSTTRSLSQRTPQSVSTPLLLADLSAPAANTSSGARTTSASAVLTGAGRRRSVSPNANVTGQPAPTALSPQAGSPVRPPNAASSPFNPLHQRTNSLSYGSIGAAVPVIASGNPPANPPSSQQQQQQHSAGSGGVHDGRRKSVVSQYLAGKPLGNLSPQQSSTNLFVNGSGPVMEIPGVSLNVSPHSRSQSGASFSAPRRRSEGLYGLNSSHPPTGGATAAAAAGGGGGGNAAMMSDSEEQSNSSLYFTPRSRQSVGLSGYGAAFDDDACLSNSSVSATLTGVNASTNAAAAANAGAVPVTFHTIPQLLAREADDRSALCAAEDRRRSRLRGDMTGIMDQLMMMALRHRSSERGLHPSLRTSAAPSPMLTSRSMSMDEESMMRSGSNADLSPVSGEAATHAASSGLRGGSSGRGDIRHRVLRSPGVTSTRSSLSTGVSPVTAACGPVIGNSAAASAQSLPQPQVQQQQQQRYPSFSSESSRTRPRLSSAANTSSVSRRLTRESLFSSVTGNQLDPPSTAMRGAGEDVEVGEGGYDDVDIDDGDLEGQSLSDVSSHDGRLDSPGQQPPHHHHRHPYEGQQQLRGPHAPRRLSMEQRRGSSYRPATASGLGRSLEDEDDDTATAQSEGTVHGLASTRQWVSQQQIPESAVAAAAAAVAAAATVESASLELSTNSASIAQSQTREAVSSAPRKRSV